MLEPLTRAARGSDVTQMQVTSWRGGAGQAAVTAVAPNAGQAAVGSRLKDGRADSAPCDQLVCYTRCDFCSSTVDCARGATSATLKVKCDTNESITFRLSSALPKRFLLLSCVTRCR